MNNVTPAPATEQGEAQPDNSAPPGNSHAAPVPPPAHSTAVPPAAAGPAPNARPPPASAAAQSAAKAKRPAADDTPHPKPDVAAVAAQPPSSTPVSTPPAASAPPLDLAALKQRLRDTDAIGVFTKLALKNQVDDLLNKFREFYRGQVKITLPELRQSYELLVQKVLALLQDSDPPLAKEITASREAIWGLLADPQKFATL